MDRITILEFSLETLQNPDHCVPLIEILTGHLRLDLHRFDDGDPPPSIRHDNPIVSAIVARGDNVKELEVDGNIFESADTLVEIINPGTGDLFISRHAGYFDGLASKLVTMTYLWLGDIQFSNLETLGRALEANASIIDLTLFNINQGSDVDFLVGTLRHNSCLKILDVKADECQDFKTFTRALAVNTSLLELTVRSKKLESLEPFVKVLDHNSVLVKLDFTGSSIRRAGGFCQALTVNTSLLKLVLNGNNKIADMDRLIEAAFSSQTLENLELRSCEVVTLPAVDVLASNQSIKMLDLFSHGSSISNMGQLLGALKVNRCLEKLYLPDGDVYDHRNEFRDMLAFNTSLISLDSKYLADIEEIGQINDRLRRNKENKKNRGSSLYDLLIGQTLEDDN